MAGPQDTVARLKDSTAWRGWTRYGDARGNLLAGGVTYFSFLSIFPALALAFTIFGIVLQDQPQVLGDIKRYLDDALPGFIQDDSGKGLIPLTVPSAQTLSITGAIAVGGLLWSGLGWLSAMRDGIRAIFHAEGSPGNAVTAKLRDLGVMVVFGVGILASAVVTVVANAVARLVADAIGIGGQGWLLTAIGVVVGAVLDGALVALLLRILSGVDLPWRGLRIGALVGGIGLTLIKVLGTRLIAGTMGNPVYGSIALVVGLLVWLNFIARIILLSAALSAADLEDQRALDPDLLSTGAEHKLREGPAPSPGVTGPRPGDPHAAMLATAGARAAQGLPTLGVRQSDRTTLAAGAVLGAVGSAAVGSAVRGAWRLARGR